MDHGPFRDQLVASTGHAVTRSRNLLRNILKQHVSDGRRDQLPSVVEHLSGLRLTKGAKRSGKGRR
jgi:hypothetical protein